MALPTATEVIAFLEGYGITTSVISEAWITSRIENAIVPWIEKKTRLNFSSEQEYTEYLSGNGKPILMLGRRPVNELVSIEYMRSTGAITLLSNIVELSKEEGMLIAKNNILEGISSTVFYKGNKNIKVIYKAGFDDFVDPNDDTVVADDIKEAILYMTAKKVLVFVGARTGGGDVAVESHGRNYGSRGKYTDVIRMLDGDAYEILKTYFTGVAGN